MSSLPGAHVSAHVAEVRIGAVVLVCQGGVLLLEGSAGGGVSSAAVYQELQGYKASWA